MKKSEIYKPTESELEVLQVLWKSGAATVRFVNDELCKKRQVGYTTTLKIMQIMADKNLLLVNKDNRQHVYSPALREEETQKQLLSGFLSKTFAGSASKLVMQVLGNHKTSAEELEKIKSLIEEIEKGGEK